MNALSASSLMCRRSRRMPPMLPPATTAVVERLPKGGLDLPDMFPTTKLLVEGFDRLAPNKSPKLKPLERYPQPALT